jgi:arylsulfatase
MMVRGEGHDPAAAPGSRASFLCLGPGWSSAANTPFRRHKTWVHEGGISTPFIVHWPAGIAARGELRHSPAHFVDIMPTLLALAAAEKPSLVKGFAVPPAPGVSLVPLFAKDGAISRDLLWWEHEGNRAIRVGDWKLVAPARGAWELYDLAKDRGESNDLAARHPEKVRELDALRTGQQTAFRSLALTDPPAAKAKAQPAQP